VVGSYLRALLFEYAATLGMIEIAYTRPEETPHSFGDAYGLDEFEYLSRYDGLLGLRLTGLGAYALGLTDAYTAAGGRRDRRATAGRCCRPRPGDHRRRAGAAQRPRSSWSASRSSRARMSTG
jgi:hypothetical protein